MAGAKIRDLPAATALAQTDLVEITADPSGTPSSKKATIALIKAAVDNRPSWVDLLLATSGSPGVSAGDFTLGVQFCAIRAGQTCVGVRFWWGGATARTIKVGLYKVGTGLMASSTVDVAGAGIYSATFAGVAIDGTSDWYASIYETSGAEYTVHVTISARVPARPVMLNYLLIQCGSYAGGDAEPSSGTRPATDSFLVEPIVEG
jgi:hypothetical protein